MANELFSTEAIRIESTPAQISANFGELNAMLDVVLKDEMTVVTEETIKDEKNRLADLRKLEKRIDDLSKDAIQNVSREIIAFKENVNTLKFKIKEVITGKDSQVKSLENSTKAIIADTLRNTLKDQWFKLGVEEEFQSANIDDLVKLTAQTSSGALTKSAFDAVKAKAHQDLQTQTQIQNRLVKLDNECLKAGINPPLPRAMVNAFLYDTDYDDKLNGIIQAELKRIAVQKKTIEDSLAEEKAKLEQRKKEIEELDKPEPTLQEQYQRITEMVEHASNKYSRYPDRENEESLTFWRKKQAEVRAKLLEENLPKTDSLYEVKVTFNVAKEHTYKFTSKPNANKDKVIAHFRQQAIKDFKLTPENILSLVVNEYDK